MECQECHQRPATLHFTQVINDHKKEVHVCDTCAYEKGYMSENSDSFSLHNLLSGLFNFDTYPVSDSTNQQSYEPPKRLQCGKCGLTYEEFTRIGKFGCAECYKTFGDKLNPIFRRVHSGNTSHDGKVPKRIGGDLHVKRQIEEQRQHLNQLIQQEEFEEAAHVRDHIRTLEREIYSDKGDGED
ncbi:UvrB/UvrC motif-containing protein [Pontibacillus salicampi]|uniref:UvrB/UvrC motif-containing protein n=1 Tax=Pontibacillus salicampi TaxID=1449801 RepID=A0ABV6LTE4_9BACI